MKRCFFFVLVWFFHSPVFIHAAVYESKVLWDKNKIVTCFFDQEIQLKKTEYVSSENANKKYGYRFRPHSRKDQKKIKGIIVAEFSRQRTGVYFSGFKKCSKTRKPDVILADVSFSNSDLQSRLRGNAGAIGKNGRIAIRISDGALLITPQEEHLTSVVILADINPYTIVHEMGHVLGLRHEHILPEALSDPNCDDIRIRSESALALDRPSETMVIYGNGYDPLSVMNYCSRERVEGLEPGNLLSPTDRAALKYLYSSP